LDGQAQATQRMRLANATLLPRPNAALPRGPTLRVRRRVCLVGAACASARCMSSL